jgi:hypothetical protein
LNRALQNWEVTHKNTKGFTRLYLPFDIYTVTLESLLNSKHPHLSNPSNLRNTSLQSLDFWKNQSQQFRSSLPINFNISTRESLWTINRNQVFKLRLASASFLEDISKLLTKTPGRIRLR